MTSVLSLTYIRPKAQVRPSRHSRAMAPITQDLAGEQQGAKQEGRNRHNSDLGDFINPPPTPGPHGEEWGIVYARNYLLKVMESRCHLSKHAQKYGSTLTFTLTFRAFGLCPVGLTISSFVLRE